MVGVDANRLGMTVLTATSPFICQRSRITRNGLRAGGKKRQLLFLTYFVRAQTPLQRILMGKEGQSSGKQGRRCYRGRLITPCVQPKRVPVRSVPYAKHCGHVTPSNSSPLPFRWNDLGRHWHNIASIGDGLNHLPHLPFPTPHGTVSLREGAVHCTVGHRRVTMAASFAAALHLHPEMTGVTAGTGLICLVHLVHESIVQTSVPPTSDPAR